jgi:hypothetical protein
VVRALACRGFHQDTDALTGQSRHRQLGGASRDSSAAGEGADPECGNGVGAAWRGGGMQWSVVTWRGANQSAAQPRG